MAGHGSHGDGRRPSPPGEGGLELGDRLVEGVRLECGEVGQARLAGDAGAVEYPAVEAGRERRAVGVEDHDPQAGIQRRSQGGQRPPGRRRLGVARLGAGEGDTAERRFGRETEPTRLQRLGRNPVGQDLFFRPRVAPPRPRSSTPDSDSRRCTNP
jgi:hypothetical protein